MPQETVQQKTKQTKNHSDYLWEVGSWFIFQSVYSEQVFLL